MLITFHIFHIHKSPCLPRGLISGVESLMWDWGVGWGVTMPPIKKLRARGHTDSCHCLGWRSEWHLDMKWNLNYLFADWCGVRLRPHISLHTWQKIRTKQSSHRVTNSLQCNSFNLWLDHAPMSHVSLLVVADMLIKYVLKLISWGCWSKNLAFNFFDTLLTLHLSIILIINQIDAQNLVL